jgi:hypothetical protein
VSAKLIVAEPEVMADLVADRVADLANHLRSGLAGRQDGPAIDRDSVRRHQVVTDSTLAEWCPLIQAEKVVGRVAFTRHRALVRRPVLHHQRDVIYERSKLFGQAFQRLENQELKLALTGSISSLEGAIRCQTFKATASHRPMGSTDRIMLSATSTPMMVKIHCSLVMRHTSPGSKPRCQYHPISTVSLADE